MQNLFTRNYESAHPLVDSTLDLHENIIRLNRFRPVQSHPHRIPVRNLQKILLDQHVETPAYCPVVSRNKLGGSLADFSWKVSVASLEEAQGDLMLELPHQA